MKKTIFISLITISTLLFSACSGQQASKKPGQGNGEQQLQETEPVIKTDDSFNTGVEPEKKKETLSPEEADFRNLKWGMTKEEVVYAQGTGYREPDENTIYYTRVREEEFPADAEYTFKDGKLVQGIFYITQDKADEPVEIGDCIELVEALKARFGDPKIADYVYASEEDTTDDEAMQLELVKNGKLQIRTGWMLDNTELRVVMFAKNGEACIGLQYKQAGVELPAR